MRRIRNTIWFVALASMLLHGATCNKKQSTPTGPTRLTHSFGWVERFVAHSWSPAVLVAGGAGLLCLGTDGIYQSPDGIQWSSISAFTAPITDAAWNGSKYIAIGGKTSYWSTDGLAWNAVASTATHTLRAIASGAGVTVAVGDSGTIVTTVDGAAWTAQSPLSLRNLRDITWSGSLFIAVGDSGTIYTSPNGTAWTVVPAGLSQNLYIVYWSGTIYLTSGTAPNGGPTYINTSADGLHWTSTAIPEFYGTLAFASSSLNYVGISISYIGASLGQLLTSQDGTSWTNPRGLPGLNGLRSVIRFNGRYIAVSGKGTILTSPDAGDWDIAMSGGDCTFSDVSSSGSVYVAVGSIFATSTDGNTWTPHLWSQNADREQLFTTIAWSGTTFVAAGYGGRIFTSSDGYTWQDHSLADTVGSIESVIWTGTQFVGVGQGSPTGTVHAAKTFSSPDGFSWTVTVTDVSKAFLRGVAVLDGRFVATGWRFTTPTSPLLLLSNDGSTWAQPSGIVPGVSLHDVVAASGKYVVGGELYVGIPLWTSTDGQTWTQGQATDTTDGSPNAVFREVAYGEGAFYAFGATSILTSSDGASWQSLKVLSPWMFSGGEIQQVTWTGDRFLMVGAQPVTVGLFNCGIYSSVESTN